MEIAPARFFSSLAALLALSMGVLLYLIFVYAPVEAQMGVAQKIFYFHVPSAFAMYQGYGACAIASLYFLWRRDDRADALAVSAAEVGLVFGGIVLVTGPLWAKKAWGVYWTWDPQLTLTLLVTLIFGSFVVLRSFGGTGGPERRFAAALAIIGLALLPVIHKSVELWSGQHPRVVRNGGGGLHPRMWPAFIMGLLLFQGIAAFLIRLRFRLERARFAAVELSYEVEE